MDWEPAPEIKIEIKKLIKSINFDHVNIERIFCFRSYGSHSRAIARIWSMPKIWQLALECEPAYCIEVISERFDRLKSDDQQKVLIHELIHIPKNFSGALLPHLKKNRGLEHKLFKEI